jgi:hypothetical protein
MEVFAWSGSMQASENDTGTSQDRSESIEGPFVVRIFARVFNLLRQSD